MGNQGIPIAGLDDDVVAGQRAEVLCPIDIEGESMLESDGEVSSEVDRIPLGPAVLGLHHGPSHRGEDGLAPAKAILQSDAEEEVP